MKKLTRFSIRHLIALTIVVAMLMPFGIAHYPKVVAFFTPPKTQPELEVIDIRPPDEIDIFDLHLDDTTLRQIGRQKGS